MAPPVWNATGRVGRNASVSGRGVEAVASKRLVGRSNVHFLHSALGRRPVVGQRPLNVTGYHRPPAPPRRAAARHRSLGLVEVASDDLRHGLRHGLRWQAMPSGAGTNSAATAQMTAAASARLSNLSARVCGDQLAHFGHERIGDLHEGLALILEGGLVFGNGLVLRLSLVVRQHLAYAILVPA